MDPREEFVGSTMGAMDLVYNIARRMVPSVEDAQDLVQDTYLAAFAAWVKGRKPDRVEPWLATICLNLARSRYRRDARRPQEVPMEFAQAVADPSDPNERLWPPSMPRRSAGRCGHSRRANAWHSHSSISRASPRAKRPRRWELRGGRYCRACTAGDARSRGSSVTR